MSTPRNEIHSRYNKSAKGKKRKADWRRRHKDEIRIYNRTYHRTRKLRRLRWEIDHARKAMRKAPTPLAVEILAVVVRRLEAKRQILRLNAIEDRLRQEGAS